MWVERRTLGLALGCAALAIAQMALAVDLDHAAGVESRRQQTELRFQQAIRASRAAPEDRAARAAREHLERARLGDLQVRQQRQAGAIAQSLRAVPPSEAAGVRYRTLERYEREQREAIGRTTPRGGAPAPPAASLDESLALPGDARRRRSVMIRPMLSP